MPEQQTAGLQHRVLLDHPAGFRPFGGTGLFERIGPGGAADRWGYG